DLSQHSYALGQDFRKTEGDGEIVLLLANAIPELADLQGCEQRRMAGKNAEVALGAGQLDLVHFLARQRALRRDDLQRDFGWQRHSSRLHAAALFDRLVDRAD